MEPQAEELLKKIQNLEAGQAMLKQEMSRLAPKEDASRGAHSSTRARSQSLSPRRPPRGRTGGFGAGWSKGSASFSTVAASASASTSTSTSKHQVPKAEKRDPARSVPRLSERHCLKVLQSMGQSVHILDLQGRIIYWYLR